MGTRARVALKNADGTFGSIYTHWDGYPSHHGPKLLKGYATQAKVAALIKLGDLSSLGESLGKKHCFDAPRDDIGDVCTAYGRDRGEKGCKAMTSPTLEALNELTQESGGEYLYVFMDGQWFVAEGGIGFFGMPASDKPGALRPLSEVVAELPADA